jgi:aspartate/methionine/tyrosine aminotransferase
MNPGDVALLMDPGYPSHSGGVHLANGTTHLMPLREERGFLPDFAAIPDSVVSQARLMVLGYPHNPTSAIAPLSFFQAAVDFCRRHNIVLAHDFTYADLVFEGKAAPSVFQADLEKQCSIEFFSLSKSYNMGGFRVAYAIGNAELIQALRQVKAVIDFNQYRGILNGAIAALNSSEAQVETVKDAFRQRRDTFVNALHEIGWHVPIPAATMYVWAKLPPAWSQDSVKFSVELVKATGVAVAPGAGFGHAGEGYVRFALVHSPSVLEKAVYKISQFLDGHF